MYISMCISKYIRHIHYKFHHLLCTANIPKIRHQPSSTLCRHQKNLAVNSNCDPQATRHVDLLPSSCNKLASSPSTSLAHTQTELVVWAARGSHLASVESESSSATVVWTQKSRRKRKKQSACAKIDRATELHIYIYSSYIVRYWEDYALRTVANPGQCCAHNTRMKTVASVASAAAGGKESWETT